MIDFVVDREIEFVAVVQNAVDQLHALVDPREQRLEHLVGEADVAVAESCWPIHLGKLEVVEIALPEVELVGIERLHELLEAALRDFRVERMPGEVLFQKRFGDGKGDRPVFGLGSLQIGGGIHPHDGHGRGHDQTQDESDPQRPAVAAEMCHDACHSFILRKKPSRVGGVRKLGAGSTT